MSKAGIPLGSRLDSARERLEKAVSEAEAAVDRVVQGMAGQSGGDETLQADLRAAQAENDSLREVNHQISQRLDQVILRLKTVLGS